MWRNTKKILNFRTTSGMGDIMHGMNLVHNLSHQNYGMHLELRCHWWHEKDHLYHCEDPETIIDRFNYIKSFYMSSNITYDHVINSQEIRWKQENQKYDWLSKMSTQKHINRWIFDPDTFLPSDEKKVVIWRPTFNAETSRLWKRKIDNDDWNWVIQDLKNKGYKITELCYRTPISEATYHINTCNFIVCYDGMWHYIAKNFYKPMLVTSINPITKYHTPQALRVSKKRLYHFLNNFYTPIEIEDGNEKLFISPYDLMQQKARNNKKRFWDWWYDPMASRKAEYGN